MMNLQKSVAAFLCPNISNMGSIRHSLLAKALNRTNHETRIISGRRTSALAAGSMKVPAQILSQVYMLYAKKMILSKDYRVRYTG